MFDPVGDFGAIFGLILHGWCVIIQVHSHTDSGQAHQWISESMFRMWRAQ